MSRYDRTAETIVDQPRSIEILESQRADHGVVAFDQGRKSCFVGNVALLRRDLRIGRYRFRVTGYRRHVVPSADELPQDAGAYVSGCAYHPERRFTSSFRLIGASGNVRSQICERFLSSCRPF